MCMTKYEENVLTKLIMLARSDHYQFENTFRFLGFEKSRIARANRNTQKPIHKQQQKTLCENQMDKLETKIN